MKSTHKTIRFDYAKIEQRDNPRQYWEFFGLHSKRGRVHVDTKRFKKVLESDETTEFLFDGMCKNRTTTYLIPKRIHRHDFKVNLIRDLLSSLEDAWVREYKPLFQNIKTPSEVYEETKLNQIASTSCSDDLDDIEEECIRASVMRKRGYERVVKSLYCQFISKICNEVDRITLLFVKEIGYKYQDFGVKDFFVFTNRFRSGDGYPLRELRGYDAYNMLHKINNFLKHNTVSAYKDLKKYYPRNVRSIENGTSSIEYENGMFAEDWIIVKTNYIDSLLKKLTLFFEEYCRLYLGEDPEESKWNYDDYFKNVFHKLKNYYVY